MTHDIFISYSSKDKAIADAVCHVLEQHGMQCWIAPRDVQPGARYAAEIVNGIKNCKVMVLVYSKESNSSEHVANEVDRAFNGGKTIIPFLVDDTPMNDEFDYYLSRKHWLVAYPHYAEQLESLAKAVANVLSVDFKSLSVPQRDEPAAVSHFDSTEAEIHIDVDADCKLYSFNKFLQDLKAGEDNVTHLKPGKYKLEFVSVEVPEVKESIVYSLSSGISCDFLEVKLRMMVLEKTPLFCIERDGKWGFEDKSGKVVIPCKWEWVRDFSEGLARVRDDNGKYGFIDKAGKLVVPCKWKDEGNFSEDLARVREENGKWGFIDKTGKLVVPCKWDNAGDFSKGLAVVRDDNGKWGFIDTTGKLVIPCKWGNIFHFSEGLARVCNWKWGFIDKTGKLVIPCKWEYAWDFAGGLAKVKDDNGVWWRIDKTGRVIGKANA